MMLDSPMVLSRSIRAAVDDFELNAEKRYIWLRRVVLPVMESRHITCCRFELLFTND